MPSLTDLIRNFRSGGLTRDEFLASIDHALEDETTPGHLARVLSEEHTRAPLPANVYTEVMRRIESRVATQYDPVAEETRVGDRSAPSSPSVSPPSLSSMSSMSSMPPSGAHVKGVGDTLNGRFVLEECLGVGGMGTVYKALDLRKLEASDRKPYIAIKVLNLQFSAHPKSLMALQREARKAQQLAHRNIVTVYDFDRDGATVFLTMEYLSGKSLSRVLRAPDFAGLPYAKALPIIIGMGRALAYAHERGFVHCDFKPANVFLTERGEVKVIDFGIARGFRQPLDDADQTVFDAGSLGGMTPAYASPEMFEHREPDPRDDIYALACVTYELLTGKHPYDRLSANQARAANLKPAQPKVLSRSQWKALRQALSLDRATRTPTVARFLEGLGAEPQHAGMRAPLLAGAAVGALLAAGLGYYAWRAGMSPHDGTESSRTVAESSGAPSSLTPTAPKPAAEPAAGTPAAARGATASNGEAPPPASATARAPSNAPLSMENVTPVLAAVPCSLLSGRIEGSILYVSGYVSESVAVKPLRERLNAVPGAGSVKLDLQPLGDDKCDVVKIVAPYWGASHGGRPQNAVSLRARGGNTRLIEGAPLVMEIATPAHDTYVYVDYYVLDGKVAHLVPSDRVQGNQAPANYHATIGDGGDWIVSKPFGTELVVLLTTPAPLFDKRRPEFETRQDYLRALEKPLAQMASKYGNDRIGADIVQISTRAR
ncbi:serine/threonine protein kinase [Cupriavidus plantarum]|uniref:serine/threonine protein kinase n=1 Tax=Cupriavidus plantarum TaxID=942865 RepID=UPI000E24EE33|nr:serine/threonine protein kinase [Cupriavidus plantarum]REE91757.1 serine/threonine protein kinase [Cupriavidus plantarum]CAG2127700.1 Serine/threonine-protein kinase PknD [Cupriavidus plantarum]SMR67122.1 serine/threonine protein kinase [Cupriavidus plantarum]